MSALILVNGHPATGKTSLALRLADELGLLCLRKDVYKEAGFDIRGGEIDRDMNQFLGRLAMRILFLDAEEVLRRGGACILEANFSADLASDEYQQLIDRYAVRGCQVLVTADSEVLLRRFLDRAQTAGRHTGHGDHLPGRAEEWKERFSRPHEPLRLTLPLIEVETIDFSTVDFAALLARVRETL